MSAHKPVVPLAIISPARNEAQFIERTIKSVLEQTVHPLEWLIVDDGSTDDTAKIVQSYAERYPFIRVISREDRGYRKLGGGVIAAFDYGREHLANADYRFIAKMDVDMTFDPAYIEIMLQTLQQESELAAVSGKVFRPEGEHLVEESIIDEHVAGQFKLYKREAFETIGGFEQTILWDGIDIHRCRMHGYTTKSFFNPNARLYHHRLMGSSDRNVYKGRVRLGKGLYFMGYHPLYLIASGVFRMKEKPFIMGGLIMIFSFFYAMLKKEARYDDPEFRKNLQQWQLQRLKSMLSR